MSNLKIVLCLLILFAGCRLYIIDSVPAMDYYYLNPDKSLSAVGRVAIVELDNDSSYPQIPADVTEALFQEVQKRQHFGLTVIRQSDPVWRSLQLDWDSGAWQNGDFGGPAKYTLDQLIAIRKTLKCDAVLVGTVTKYQPYPHMAIGLRLKLVDLTDGQLIWAVEQIWDGTDKTTEQRIKNYFQYQIRSGFEPLREQLAAVSPLKFIRFVAYEVAATL